MNSRSRKALSCVLIAFLSACNMPNAPEVTDLRLEGITPPQTVNLAGPSGATSPQYTQPVIVVDLSTARDLRYLAVHHADSTGVHVVLCRGRSRITERDLNVDVVAIALLLDAGGFITDTLPRAEWPGATDGRYRYRVPIRLRGQRMEDLREGVLRFSLAEFDLMREPVDLCLMIDTTGDDPRWRSNTVVIPADAIRAAVSTAIPR